MSLNSSENGSEAKSLEGEREITKANPDQVHSRTASRKVDYVVVIDIVENDPLFVAIHRASFKSSGKLHINQTNYTAIRTSPIAISIETKASLDDARV